MDQEGLAKNREIEKTIKADQKKAAREVKLLLLGEQIVPVPNCQFPAPNPQFARTQSLPSFIASLFPRLTMACDPQVPERAASPLC